MHPPGRYSPPTAEAYDRDCPFCAIARGEDRPAHVICEDDGWIAFFPLKPAAAGHTLVIPRTHVADFWSSDSPTASDLVLAAKRVGAAINDALSPDGFNLITSAGSAAEQTVFHLHLHVVPRWDGDSFGPIWAGSEVSDDVDLDDVAERIRRSCID
jgi:histidine triad (HIT) family protein